MNALAELLLFIVSVLPVFLIGLFIYKKGKQNGSEKLLVKLFIGGIGSCFLVLVVSLILKLIFPIMSADRNSLNLFELIIYVFIGVALVEESCKWIMVYKISYNDDQFDRFYDAIVYSVFVALGFACFENLLYVYSNGIGNGIARALLAVPGHACDGIFMGYYLGLAKISDLNSRKDLKKKNLILSIVVPTILHEIYDYCLFTGKPLFIILFFIFVICMYIYSFKKVKKVSSINRKMKYKDNFCPNCGHEVDGNYCPICGRKNE